MENAASTATRLTQLIDNWAYDSSQPPAKDDNDETEHEPLTIPLAEPETSMSQFRLIRPRSEDVPGITYPQTLKNSRLSAAEQSSAHPRLCPDIRKALESISRDQWINTTADEIIDNMINSTRTLVPEEVECSKSL